MRRCSGASWPSSSIATARCTTTCSTAQLEAAVRAYHRGKLPQCRRLLAEADDSIRRAGLDRDPLRRWWSTRAYCLRDQADQADARLQTSKKRWRSLPNSRPGQRGHVTALAGWRPNPTATKAARPNPWLSIGGAIAWLGPAAAQRAELPTLHSNLGIALQQAGDLAGTQPPVRPRRRHRRASADSLPPGCLGPKRAHLLPQWRSRAGAGSVRASVGPRGPHNLSIVMPCQ